MSPLQPYIFRIFPLTWNDDSQPLSASSLKIDGKSNSIAGAGNLNFNSCRYSVHSSQEIAVYWSHQKIDKYCQFSSIFRVYFTQSPWKIVGITPNPSRDCIRLASFDWHKVRWTFTWKQQRFSTELTGNFRGYDDLTTTITWSHIKAKLLRRGNASRWSYSCMPLILQSYPFFSSGAFGCWVDPWFIIRHDTSILFTVEFKMFWTSRKNQYKNNCWPEPNEFFLNFLIVVCGSKSAEWFHSRRQT